MAIPNSASAQPAGKAQEPLNPTPLVVSPAAEPVPALKYRLLPSFADLNPGDAAPIYLRIRHATPDGLWNQSMENMEGLAECAARTVPDRRGSQVRR